MDAWSSDPIPEQYLKGRTALERHGALVLQLKQCRNCHALEGAGGQRGPALDGVAVRLTQDQLIRQLIQGGGNMPAYGKNLSPAETTALVAFLETLHPGGQGARAQRLAGGSRRCAALGPHGLRAGPQHSLPGCSSSGWWSGPRSLRWTMSCSPSTWRRCRSGSTEAARPPRLGSSRVLHGSSGSIEHRGASMHGPCPVRQDAVGCGGQTRAPESGPSQGSPRRINGATIRDPGGGVGDSGGRRRAVRGDPCR